MIWTPEQRREALGDLHRAAQDCDEMESCNSGVSYNSAMVDIACERNALREAAQFLVKNCTAETYSPWDTALKMARAALEHTNGA